jgi:hypothetical protein
MDDTALRPNPRTSATTGGFVPALSTIGRRDEDGLIHLGKNTAHDECPYCGAPYKRYQAGECVWFGWRDDCCATRAAEQAWNFSRHANDPALPAGEREDHQAFLARMMQRSVSLEPAKRPSVRELYARIFTVAALEAKGSIVLADDFDRTLVREGWLPEHGTGGRK